VKLPEGNTKEEIYQEAIDLAKKHKKDFPSDFDKMISETEKDLAAKKKASRGKPRKKRKSKKKSCD